MRKRDRKLLAIAFDAAGHAKSKNSGLHPFLGEASREQGFESITIDILNLKFKEEFLPPEEISLALPKLLHKLEDLLSAQNYELSNLIKLEASYTWDKHYPDWQCSFKVTAETDTNEIQVGEEHSGPGYFM
jgi:hypothetical protein